jgi:hypothetical protein
MVRTLYLVFVAGVVSEEFLSFTSLDFVLIHTVGLLNCPMCYFLFSI